MPKITPNEFRDAFKYVWDKEIEQNSDKIPGLYVNDKSWTKFMLGDEGFFKKMLDRLNHGPSESIFKREYYTIDALYVGGEDLFGEKKSYPSELQVLIEHENGDKVEEEMWKLVFWRSPLKVIVFYDWNEYDKNTDKRKKWLECKLQKLAKMLKEANSYFPENTETKYLFIIGNRKEKDQLPHWRWASIDQIQPTHFAGG